MKSQIAISVVIPAYNEAQLIGRCLDSLTHQNFTLPYEIIVVNNNSIDKTLEIAKSFGVKVITEKTQSVVVARQRGLQEAKGEIVACADCDSLYPPDWLSKIYQHFVNNPNVVAVGGQATAEKNPYWAYLVYKYSFALVNFMYQTTGSVLYIGGFNFAYRRKAFLDLGGYHTYLDFGGDELDPLGRLKKVGKIVFDPEITIELSSRRYRVGFLKFWLIHGFYYYFLSYPLAKLFKKALIRAQPVRNI